MTRALIAIGVNAYDHTDDLASAEQDASKLFEQLTKDEVGNYDPVRSRLLLSPTLQEVRDTIGEIVFSQGAIEELTFYFAGHGAILPVGFYMYVRDTRNDRPVISAFGMTEFFTHISQAAPQQTNVIVDACFSGGLAVDLNVLTRPETSGYVGSPAVTMLAMAARNRTAAEVQTGGLGTTALLECLSGGALVREDTPNLDLLDIGKVVIERVCRAGVQAPIISALSVHRRSSFCANPLFQATAKSAVRNWNARSFLTAVAPVLAAHAEDPAALILDVERLFDRLIAQADAGRDLFRGVEVRAAAIVALLRAISQHEEVRNWVCMRLIELNAALEEVLHRAVEALIDEPHAMLAEGLADLFLLPIKISKLLGWAGAAYHLGRLQGTPVGNLRTDIAQLFRLVLEQYTLSASAMSDNQAPYVALAATGAFGCDLGEEGAQYLSSVFQSFVEYKGKVADLGLEPENIPLYLMARQMKTFDQVTQMVAQPTELGVVLLMAAKLFDLEDVFDYALSELDHLPINAFIPEVYEDFGRQRIREGQNVNFRIGQDIWTVDDLIRHWPVAGWQAPGDQVVAAGAILASLLFPDRVPWFVFPKSALADAHSLGDT